MVLGSGIRDPGSRIRKKPILDPGSRGQKAPDPGSRIQIRNTGCIRQLHFLNKFLCFRHTERTDNVYTLRLKACRSPPDVAVPSRPDGAAHLTPANLPSHRQSASVSAGSASKFRSPARPPPSFFRHSGYRRRPPAHQDAPSARRRGRNATHGRTQRLSSRTKDLGEVWARRSNVFMSSANAVRDTI